MLHFTVDHTGSSAIKGTSVRGIAYKKMAWYLFKGTPILGWPPSCFVH